MQLTVSGKKPVFLGLVLAAALSACSTAEPLPKLTYAERPCYRTLADVDCHSHALVGEERRRVDSYDAPIAVEQEEAWPQRLF